MKAKNNSEFEEVLASVSPELVKNYEKLNLSEGMSLKQAAESVYVNKRKGKIVDFLITLATLFTLPGAIVSTFVMVYFKLDHVLSAWAVFSQVIIGLMLVFYLVFFKANKCYTSRQHLTFLLESFQKTVKALNPTGRTMRTVSAESVREELVCIAVWILDAERKLDQIRKLEHCDVSQLVHLGQYIQSNRGKLEDLLNVAERFGLKFKRAELFAEAKKYLERMR